MIISGKVWGKTCPMFCKNNVEIHRLEGKKDGYSSKHTHKYKYNMFYVESGEIEVITWKTASKPDSIKLKAGEASTVSPGHKHQFKVVEDCVVYEIYWVELLEDDIERYSVGGIKNG